MEQVQVNKDFERAIKFALQTDRNIFLTGKAGTGKTTFLRHICSTSHKKIAVVAPTGVAAINAGGVTIHSFFQLAPGLFLPAFSQHSSESGIKIYTPDTLLRTIRFSSQKRELIRELDTLVIDEVSMLKADTLDSMDFLLRHIRQQRNLPFGGVQVIFIGDLFQLPPVVTDFDWELMREYYPSPFFFDAKVINQATLIFLELKTIYRQNNADFIYLLNTIRNNIAGPKEFAVLHSRYLPDFYPDEQDGFITLTTHNARAEVINRQALKKLDGSPKEFKAQIKGDFPEKSYPADCYLSLKEGAQIMFIKNDKGENRRYYNGRIGTVSRIDGDKVYVHFGDLKSEFELERETWLNIRYQLDKEKNLLKEEELGRFEQFPIRLAWAITIHKSQGLTFEKAIIDAGDSFSAGQVYVALSRLTSLDGMILKSRIPASAVKTDQRVLNFSNQAAGISGLDELLFEEQTRFIRNTLIRSFGLDNMLVLIKSIHTEFREQLIPPDSEDLILVQSLETSVQELQKVGANFQRQLEQLFYDAGDEMYGKILLRVESGAGWFSNSLNEIKSRIKSRSPLRPSKRSHNPVSKFLKNFLLSTELKLNQLDQALKLASALAQQSSHDELLKLSERCSIPENSISAGIDIPPSSAPKSKSGQPSAAISLDLFKSGKTIKEIADHRALTQNTISEHLIGFLNSGEVKLTDLVEETKIPVITKALESGIHSGLKQVKDHLGHVYTYTEIKAVRQAIGQVQKGEHSDANVMA